MVFTGEAAPVGMERAHYLVALRGEEPGRRIEVTNEPVVMGRGTDAHVRFRDPRVSTRHCSVWLAMDQVVVSDLGSTNGTLVDGERIEGERVLMAGSVLQIGSQVLKHELLTLAEVRQTEEREEDLHVAGEYVRSLLPPPLDQGPVLTDWVFVPTGAVGGDAFGYHRLPDDRFAVYLLDVTGHGTGSALHSVSVLNVLSQEASPDTDFGRPEAVLVGLNRMFGMEDHGGMFVTCWYGVFDPTSRSLRYASAGHPPAFLVSGDRDRIQPLHTQNPAVGLIPEATFSGAETKAPPGSVLYVYSDGAFEFTLKDEGRDWTIEELGQLIARPPEEGTKESVRIHRGVLGVAKGNELMDDFSILVVTFP